MASTLPQDVAEAQIQLALQYIITNPGSSIRKTAVTFNVPRSTLQARYNGRRSAKESQQAVQRLSVAEEGSLINTINLMTSWGWPMRIPFLESMATELLIAKGDHQPLGQHWYKNFLARHPQFKLKYSRGLDQKRKDAGSYNTVQDWFQLYRDTCLKYGIPDGDQYNMDEKGFAMGLVNSVKVIVPIEEAQAFVAQPGNRDWVSVIECISGNCYSLPAFVIFEGQRIIQSWVQGRNLDNQMVINVSENGWTTRAIALKWLEHFHKHTRRRLQAQYRLLILDGHDSHVSFDFIKKCELHQIIPLCLPPHSTHLLQPLDIGIFSPLAQAYKSRIQAHSVFGAQNISKAQFLTFFDQSRREAISMRNIASAWKAAGLIPFETAPILSKLRPKTPPFASITDENGRRLDIAVEPHVAQKINEIISQLLEGVPSTHHADLQFIQEQALMAIADRSNLQSINRGLVEKQQQARQKRTKKTFGNARILTVKDAQDKIDLKAQQLEEIGRAHV